ncbi:MAG TPA: PKD domain-containing protein [Candidatus Lumbricidophila sp.]|nr:PKD domain-containing protein [Candidatus Lumbricidophila sp.]
MRAIARARIAALALATGVGVALTLSGVVNPAAADTAPPAGVPATASADVLPAPQINGVVWTQAIAGNIAYVGGEFTTARPAGAAPGTNEVSRPNLLAYNLTTGELIASFNPGPNAQVQALAVTPDGSKLFVGGQFTSIGGQTRYRIAAFDAATGALLAWAPTLNASVYALAATNSTVYAGGAFSNVNGAARTRLAAMSTTSNTLLPWAPQIVDGSPKALVVKPDGSQVVIGGSFSTLNGSSNPGMGLASVDGVTAELRPWAVNNVVRNAGAKGGIYSLTQDGTYVYGTGWMFSQSAGTLEGTFKASWDGGALTWVEDCHGDTYGVAATTDAVYVTGHTHYCGNTPGGFPQTSPNWTFYRGLAFTQSVQGVAKKDPLGYHNWEGTPEPALLHWYPNINTGTYTGSDQGAWNLVTDGRYLLYGGEFTRVNGILQQGLVRFALPGTGLAPLKNGPVYSGATSVPIVNALASDAVRITWPANVDYDNESLVYELTRDGALIYTKTELSKPWLRPTMGYFDTSVTPGTTYKYRLRATDANGNTSVSDYVTITTGTGPGLPAYQKAVLTDASNYWTMNEPSGTTMVDSAGIENAIATSGVVRGTAQATFGDPNGFSSQFVPSSFAATQVLEPTPNTFSAEAWFKTNTNRGGKIFGFGNKLTGNSSSYDRHVYMTNTGRLYFGVYTGATVTAQTTQSYNDNQWHHVVATLGPSGMALYVDGALKATNTATSGQSYSGVFRIGGDNLGGWPSRPTNDYFTGNVDDVALYPAVLSASQVQNHYLLGTTGTGINVTPTAAFATTATDVDVTFDGSTSSDSDGSIASYAWNFGDGTTGTGANPTHTYATAGDKTVTLTVTDNRGATGSVTQTITVVANQAPNASFTSSVNFLNASFDGTGSTDADGTVSSYAWNFGDGASATGATASHSYAAAGTYSVSLTVTDNRGASTTTSRSVTATQPPNTAPTAAFGSSSTDLALSVDGTGSSDSDGSIASYAWNFGDGATATGATASHTYAAGGTYTVSLTVTDNEGATGTLSKQVTVLAANQAPTASFTVAGSNLTATVDGTGSSDPDGSINSHAWNYGDGTTGSGATASHTYAAAGTYTITLTVTDNRGGTATTTRQITLVQTVIAQDDFNRVSTGTFGTAVTGGAWTGTNSGIATDGSTGNLTLKAGQTLQTLLNSVSSSNMDFSVTFGSNQPITGSGLYVTAIARQIGTENYVAGLRIYPTGVVNMKLQRSGVTLATRDVTGLTYTTGQRFNLRVQAFGTSPTTIQAKVWPVGQPEPTAWTLTTTDTTPTLQTTGSIGLIGYLGGTATSPVTVAFDDLLARPAI